MSKEKQVETLEQQAQAILNYLESEPDQTVIPNGRVNTLKETLLKLDEVDEFPTIILEVPRRYSDAALVDLVSEALKSQGKWTTAFDDQNTLNDWVSFIVIHLARAIKTKNIYDPKAQYKALIEVANLAMLVATRVQEGIVAERHYD